jgi:hypothetical protein
MSPFHEGDACDAVLRCIEARDGGRRSDLRFPDRDGHRDPVELTCRLNGKFYAIEHTGIEPFFGQIALGNHAASFFKPIEERLARTLPPPDVFELYVPVEATCGLKRRTIGSIQAAIIRWVEQEALSLPVSRTGRLMGPLQKRSVPGVPFPLSLFRHRRLIEATPPIVVLHVVGGDQEKLRRERIEAGYRKKMGKLAAWRRDAGARTILVFEDNDIQLTNPGLVAEAVLDIVARSDDRPDEIYLVTSCVEPWWVSPALVENVSLFEAGDYQRAWEIPSAELTPLTSR